MKIPSVYIPSLIGVIHFFKLYGAFFVCSGLCTGVLGNERGVFLGGWGVGVGTREGDTPMKYCLNKVQ